MPQPEPPVPEGNEAYATPAETAASMPPSVPMMSAPTAPPSRASAARGGGVRARYADPFNMPAPESEPTPQTPSMPLPTPTPVETPAPAPAPAAAAAADSLGGPSPASDAPKSRFGGFGGLMGAALGSVSKAFEKKNSQLDDQEEFIYNAEFGAWMPKSADPAKWAADNLAGPPPPPKAGGGSSSAVATPSMPGIDAGPTMSAPQTPLPPGAGGGPGNLSAPATGGGPGAFSQPRASGSRARPSTRSRYVDTFNTEGDGAPTDKSDSEMMPPPASRPARPKPTFFTPQRTPGADDDAPMFMTPKPAGDDVAAADDAQ